MSTPFMLAYAHTIVHGLLAQELLVLTPQARPEDLVRELAAFLMTRQGHSAISSTSRGLLQSERVEELFADDADIKSIIDQGPLDPS